MGNWQRGDKDISADPEKIAVNPEAALIDKLLDGIRIKLKLAKITPKAFAKKLLLQLIIVSILHGFFILLKA